MTVRIVGKPAVTSGATGGFTFTDVSPPYDLYIVGQSGLAQSPFPTVYYYKGLTRPDPIVTAPATFFLTLFTSSNAPVSGVKSGNADVTNQMLIAWESGGSVVVNPSGYSLTASWSPAASTKAGTLYGFQFSKKATGAPDVFTGFGSSGQVTLTQNTASLINLSMPAPTTAALTGTITAPAGFPNPTIQLNQQIGTGTVNLWNSSPTTAADATIPVIASGKSAMAATSTLDGATTQFVHPSINAATSVAFALPAPAVQTAPVNAATGVTTTTPFTWSPTPMTVYELNIGSTTVQGSAKARFQVFTTTPMATIPQVPELVLPSNQSFTWFVNGYGPNVSIDDAASATGLLTVSATDYTNTVVHSFTNSTDRTLTSAP